jgi:GT2 family glycosyltransferase
LVYVLDAARARRTTTASSSPDVARRRTAAAAVHAPAAPRLSVIVPATDEPPTLSRTVAAIERSVQEGDEVIVVCDPPLAGPAQARNIGAGRAAGEVLVFVDADVEVHPDALPRIRAAFQADARLTAIMGAYDAFPAARGVVSTFRNLLHHHVHHMAAGPGSTFWTGLGAVRRDAFDVVGGFDAARFPRPSVEDVEFGMRLADRGGRIVLDPLIQGKHLKRWTLREMVATDFLRRGLPWVRLLLARRAAPTTLNLGWRHRLSALASMGGPAALCLGDVSIGVMLILCLITLNSSFYALLLRRGGPVQAAGGVVLHAIHHLTAAAALAVGVGQRVSRMAGGSRRRRLRTPSTSLGRRLPMSTRVAKALAVPRASRRRPA